jgi:hypothetical protein
MVAVLRLRSEGLVCVGRENQRGRGYIEAYLELRTPRRNSPRQWARRDLNGDGRTGSQTRRTAVVFRLRSEGLVSAGRENKRGRGYIEAYLELRTPRRNSPRQWARRDLNGDGRTSLQTRRTAAVLL